MKILKRLLRITRIALLAILAVYAGAAFVLVNLSDPVFKPVTKPAPTTEMSEMLKQVYANQADKFIMRDKAELFAQHFQADSNLTLICYNDEAMAAAGNWLAKNGLTETKLSAPAKTWIRPLPTISFPA